MKPAIGYDNARARLRAAGIDIRDHAMTVDFSTGGTTTSLEGVNRIIASAKPVKARPAPAKPAPKKRDPMNDCDDPDCEVDDCDDPDHEALTADVPKVGKITKRKTRTTTIVEIEEDDGKPDDGDDDEPEEQPKPKDKKTVKKESVAKPLGPKALARAVASALAAPGIRRAVRREEQEHAKTMSHLEVLVPGATETVRRVHVRECHQELTRLNSIDRAKALGLTAVEIAMCQRTGCAFEGFASAKASEPEEDLSGNSAYESATGKRLY